MKKKRRLEFSSYLPNPCELVECDARSILSAGIKLSYPRPVAVSTLKNTVCLKICPLLKGEYLDSNLSQGYKRVVKCNQPHQGFELESQRPFPGKITITTLAPIWLWNVLGIVRAKVTMVNIWFFPRSIPTVSRI